MRVLIAFRSKYGTTESCAGALAERIRAETAIVDLRFQRHPDPRPFDVVLVGGSIYGGKIQREVTSFCESDEELLLGRKIGLFLCCLSRGEHALEQLQSAFPESLAVHAFARSLFGGELRYGKLSALDRVLVRGIPRPTGDASFVDSEAISAMAEAVNAFLPGA